MINTVHLLKESSIAFSTSIALLVGELDYALMNEEIEFDEYEQLKQKLVETEKQIQNCIQTLVESNSYQREEQDTYDYLSLLDLKGENENAEHP